MLCAPCRQERPVLGRWGWEPLLGYLIRLPLLVRRAALGAFHCSLRASKAADFWMSRECLNQLFWLFILTK